MRAFLLVGLMIIGVSPASAALPIGSRAPDFRTMGALGGKPFKSGPSLQTNIVSSLFDRGHSSNLSKRRAAHFFD